MMILLMQGSNVLYCKVDVGMSEEHSTFICRVSVERHVHVVVECTVRDVHFAVIEVREVKRASVDTLQ